LASDFFSFTTRESRTRRHLNLLRQARLRLLVAGWHGRAGWLFSVGYAMFAALLAWGIIALNQRAVRRTLLPKREDVLRLLAQMES